MTSAPAAQPTAIEPAGHRRVLVVDFGGQYSQLIVRRVRELGIFSEMVPYTQAELAIRTKRPDSLILSGGPRSVLEPDAPDFDVAVIEGIPTLGICYGQQWLALKLGGKVANGSDREYGHRTIDLNKGSWLEGIESGQVWMSHGDQVLEAPPGFTVAAMTASCPVAAFENLERRIFGVQFHPEVSHTPSGREVLRRFLIDHAQIQPDWSSEAFIEEAIAAIRQTVGSKRVLCAVSGGVDSSVVAALMTEAIGDQVTCVFVDHGLLRKNEAQEVIEQFSGHFRPRLCAIEAGSEFLGALEGVIDPEQKRKIIGEQFIRVFEANTDAYDDCDFLAQGTLYPDVIESGSPTAAKIKTHHNVGGLPSWMRLQVIEPLRWLFKDEVREVGRKLGLPETMVEREPFPGPGLAVRILGEVTEKRVRIVQEADAIFREELRASGHHRRIWQSYAALLDVRSVGVMGDERTYLQPIVLRAVESEDAMTATAVELPFELLQRVASRIVNEVEGVNRVLYDLTSKPPATIEWE